MLPLVGKGKKKAFNRIKDMVGRKIARWKGKLLSNAGREILIKVVAQATPTYTMTPELFMQGVELHGEKFLVGAEG